MSGQPHVEWISEEERQRLALLSATAEGNLHKVRSLIKSGVPVDAFDDDYLTPLQIAAALGDSYMVAFLIESRAEVDACNQLGMTAFHHACREGRLQVIEALLQSGADIGRPTYLGATGLTLAAAGGHLDVVKKLVGLHLEVSPKILPSLCPSPLVVAAVNGMPQICGYLISRTAAVDETIPTLGNLTALTAVILCSRPENSYNTIISALLDLGASPTRRTYRNSKSAIELAQELQREEISLTLNDNNRIRHVDLVQPTDFRQLLRENKLDKLQEALLAKTTFMPDAVTPLMWAVAVGSVQGVYKLLELRYNVDAQETKHGYSALMLAAFLRENEMVDALLECGAGVEKTEPNTLHQTSYDLYLCASDELDPDIRARLHRYKPKTKKPSRNDNKKFSGSGSKSLAKRFGQFSHMVSRTKTQLGLAADPQDGGGQLTMRDWMENRIQASLVDGRNHRKLVRVEQILHRLRHISPPLMRSLDSDFEAVRSLAAEFSSFALVTFYDRYSETHIERRVESEPTSQEYDLAMKFAKEYSYGGGKEKKPIRPVVKPRTQPAPLYLRKEGSEFARPRVRSMIAIQDGPPSVSLRTTPRMLKGCQKSRDSLILEGGEMSPGRAPGPSFQFPPTFEMRKTVSTPSLPGQSTLSLLAPRITEPHGYSLRSTLPAPVGDEEKIWGEMRRRGLADKVEVMISEEIDFETFFALTREDLQKMQIRDSETIASILDIQNSLGEMWGHSYM